MEGHIIQRREKQEDFAQKHCERRAETSVARVKELPCTAACIECQATERKNYLIKDSEICMTKTKWDPRAPEGATFAYYSRNDWVQNPEAHVPLPGLSQGASLHENRIINGVSDPQSRSSRSKIYPIVGKTCLEFAYMIFRQF